MKKQPPLIMVLILLHFLLALSYSLITPLGEAPDEPAHVAYARFIATEGRLPSTLAERQEARYKSTWPPLYHLLITPPFAMVNGPPHRLKAVGDGPRRLIPTNGHTIASYIHTTAESFPWRGLPLAWHWARFITIGLGSTAVGVTYLLARKLTAQPSVALTAAALHAFLPQMLFLNGIVSDDNLLILLSGLILLILTHRPQTIRHHFLLGLLLGLATVTKYSILPLWLVILGWLIINHVSVSKLIALASATLLSSGWWFGFIWLNFNQVAELGPLHGSIAALTAGTADASLREISTSPTLNLPSLAQWLEWLTLLFQSFWGLFGGGSTIEYPGWLYGLLALLSLLTAARLLHGLWRGQFTRWLLLPLIFLPLPLLRFLLSGNLVETAQGRHFFPAMPLIALGFALALHHSFYSLFATRKIIPMLSSLLYLLLPLTGLMLIARSYPPPIPLYTNPAALNLESPPETIPLTESISLLHYEIAAPQNGMLPLTLIWQAERVPPTDYLIELLLRQPNGAISGSWLGHPLGGRYPTRAWDEGDLLRDHIRIPLQPSQPATTATLTMRLYDSRHAQFSPPISLTPVITLPATPRQPRSPAMLRADGLPAEAPFSYRGTLSFALVDDTAPAPTLLDMTSGALYPPRLYHPSDDGTHLAHFLVAADWASGPYRLQGAAHFAPVSINNRPRRFTPPPLPEGNLILANFGNTISLLGYELPQRTINPDETVPVTLVWQAQRTMGRSLTVFNHLLDEAGVRHGGADRIPQQYYTTLLWVPQEVVVDAYTLPVEPTAPPGIYWLHVGLYPTDEPQQSLSLVDATSGQPLPQSSIRLGPIKVGGPPPETTLTEITPQHPLGHTFGKQITLLGYDCPSTVADCQDELTFYWQAEQPPPHAYNVFLHILDQHGEVVAQVDGPPAAGRYPTNLWANGEIIVDSRPLPELPPGDYTISMGLYRLQTGERLPVSGLPNGVIEIPLN